MRVSPCLAEEAVNEVKRQAMAELQKAVSEAERKAHDMITSERAKMERTVAEAKRQAAEDALAVINQQEDSSEVRALLGKHHLGLPTIGVSELALICSCDTGHQCPLLTLCTAVLDVYFRHTPSSKFSWLCCNLSRK